MSARAHQLIESRVERALATAHRADPAGRRREERCQTRGTLQRIEVTLFESTFERYSLDVPVPASGGGILRDFGSHLVDQALLLFGPVASVYGEVRGAGQARRAGASSPCSSTVAA